MHVRLVSSAEEGYTLVAIVDFIAGRQMCSAPKIVLIAQGRHVQAPALQLAGRRSQRTAAHRDSESVGAAHLQWLAGRADPLCARSVITSAESAVMCTRSHGTPTCVTNPSEYHSLPSAAWCHLHHLESLMAPSVSTNSLWRRHGISPSRCDTRHTPAFTGRSQLHCRRQSVHGIRGGQSDHGDVLTPCPATHSHSLT
jgi:hypothetical protein